MGRSGNGGAQSNGDPPPEGPSPYVKMPAGVSVISATIDAVLVVNNGPDMTYFG